MATKHKFPEWIRQGWASGGNVEYTRGLVDGHGLHTVCQSAKCPNLGECWKKRTATVMILGNLCTRNCRYCSVPSGKPTGDVDADEPRNVGAAVSGMGLNHVVVTSVTRDDLPDGGAAHFVETIDEIRRQSPGTTVELLTPDFLGDEAAIGTVLSARPEVFGHNIETVARLYPALRGRRYTYELGLGVLRTVRRLCEPVIRKSAFMVGHGETEDEVRQTLADLLEAGCDAVSIGQYLKPSKKQRDVAAFVHPDTFRAYEDMARAMGFRFAVAGPFVRSSYRSDEMMKEPFAAERVRTLASWRPEPSGVETTNAH
jgi:lipoic acid synthetase